MPGTGLLGDETDGTEWSLPAAHHVSEPSQGQQQSCLHERSSPFTLLCTLTEVLWVLSTRRQIVSLSLHESVPHNTGWLASWAPAQ